MDNALSIMKAHIREYGDSFSPIGLSFMLDIYEHVWNAAFQERLSRA